MDEEQSGQNAKQAKQVKPGRPKLQLTIVLIVFFLITSLSSIVLLITDYLWFDAIGFEQVFLTIYKTKIMLFLMYFAIFFGFVLINLMLAAYFRRKSGLKSFVPMKLKVLLAASIAVLIGLSASGRWETVLRYFNQAEFGISDPIFSKDAAFYVFTLPYLEFVWGIAFATILLTIAIIFLDYFQAFIYSAAKKGSMKYKTGEPYPEHPGGFRSVFEKLKSGAKLHIAALISIFFMVLAFRHYLSRFSIMFSEKGIVVGAGYTDVNVFLPAVRLLMVIAVFLAVFFFVWTVFINKKKLGKRHVLLYVISTYLAFILIGQLLLPSIVQTLKVGPNEMNLERPFIENNIRLTRIAYGLDNVEEHDFAAEELLTIDDIDLSPEIIDNIRILDWRPLITTYKQTQEIRLYYDLSGIDVDRYDLDGKYTQVMLAPRELEQSQITANAKTWINLHLVYTHGYGAVMSPVNKVTSQGLPDYLIKDIPPIYTIEEPGIRIDRPEIYYGEIENEYVIANTATAEFDYPMGDTNKYVHYDGKGGVIADTFAKKALMALRFWDLKIILSPEIKPESKFMYYRNIQERISKIAPFLSLDADPYLVIDQGRLFWMQDAYTVTSNFPYSDKHNGINYIRNPVKIVVDAYHGDVTFYAIDRNEPILATYARVFPSLIKDFSEMPEGLKGHVRYPEDMFRIQSLIYTEYHMNDSTVFYNKEDSWDIPFEIYGTGQQVLVEPYYIITKIPGEDDEEFILMMPFTPIRKNNMVAWLAARSDNDDYGKLLLYKFPKDKLVFGPSQIEAKIDQDSEISQQLTLWSQQGSSVTRGNLLVIPIRDSLLYVEPLYIQSEKSQLPELKRVLLSDGERVVMEENLGLAIEALFGKTAQVPTRPGGIDETNQTSADLVSRASEYYLNILRAMQENDWEEIGLNFEKLGEVIEDLESQR